MKILAVDDDVFILELLTMMAARAGFKDVSTASSGEVALAMMTDGEEVFDCLLLDISMPGMDGIELCALARALPMYAKTPIIMLTAMAEKDYIDRAFSAGATDYANKPFEIVELHARLKMAEQLITAQRLAAADEPGSGAGLSDPRVPTLSVEDEFEIEGLQCLIGYNALKNYLMQLSDSGIAGSQVSAVKIDQIDAIHENASGEEFLYALTEVADAIDEVFKKYGYMMAYAGNGAFVVVSGKATMESSASIEDEIQDILDERGAEYDDGRPMDVDVSVGNPLRPSPSKARRVRKTFDRAIARAENRASSKAAEPRSTGARFVGQ